MHPTKLGPKEVDTTVPPAAAALQKSDWGGVIKLFSGVHEPPPGRFRNILEKLVGTWSVLVVPNLASNFISVFVLMLSYTKRLKALFRLLAVYIRHNYYR